MQESWIHSLSDCLSESVVIHRNGEIVFANSAFAELVGCRRDCLIGLPLDRFVSSGPPKTGQRTVTGPGEGVAAGEKDLSIRTASGSLRRVRVHSGSIVYQDLASTIAVLSDKTEQERIEQELRASEERYRLLGEIIPFGVWATDPEGNFTYCSDSFMSLLGLCPGDFTGYRWIQKLPPQDRDRTLADWKQFIETGCLWDYEYRVIDTVGKEWFVLSRGAPIRDGQGSVLSFAGIHLDITARRSAVRGLEASLREKEVIIKEVHHRVKNNMAVMSGLINLQAAYTDDPAVVERLEECQQQVKTMALVHEHLYQGESLEFIDSSSYFESLVNELVNASRLSTRIDRDIRVEHMNIDMDIAIPCGLIVNELVTNALKHAFPGRKEGMLRVEMRLTPAHRYFLAVEDNGTGLPPDFDQRSQSTLGMQLVQALVKQLGGEMAVSSKGGARFTIEFPEKFVVS